MATKRKELSDLQRDLLQLALQGPKAKIWLPKASQQSFPTTYAAIVALQRRGLLDAEQGKNPDILSWKVTKEGRDALKEAQAAPSPLEPASPPPAASQGHTTKAPVAPAASSQGHPAKAPVAPAAKQSSPAAQKPDSRGRVAGKEAAPPAKPARSTRAAPAAPAAPAASSREKGGKGKAAAVPAKSDRSPAPAAGPGEKSSKPAPAKSGQSPAPAAASGEKSSKSLPAKSGRSVRSSAPAEAPRERGGKAKAVPATGRNVGKTAASAKTAPAPKKSGGRGRT
jgi:hypothetical protein